MNRHWQPCALALIAFSSSVAWAGRESGGGIDQIIDFNEGVLQITRWLKNNGESLNPPVNSTDFYVAASPEAVVPVNDLNSESNTVFFVTRNCDGKKPLDPSDLRQACYDSATDKIYLSESRYPLNQKTPARLGLIAHEVFRRMRLEGDDYKVSRQMSFVTVPDGDAPSENQSGVYKPFPEFSKTWPDLEVEFLRGDHSSAIISMSGTNATFAGMNFDCNSMWCVNGRAIQYTNSNGEKCSSLYKLYFLEDRNLSLSAETYCGHSNVAVTSSARYRFDHSISTNQGKGI